MKQSIISLLLLVLFVNVLAQAQQHRTGHRHIVCGPKPGLSRRPSMGGLGRTKYHEAGHAIAGLAMGVGVGGIHVSPDGSGWCDVNVGNADLDAVIDAAGHAGEKLKYGDTDGGEWLDFQNAIDRGAPVTQANRIARAKALIRKNWRAFEAIANAIPNNGTLSSEQVHRLWRANGGQVLVTSPSPQGSGYQGAYSGKVQEVGRWPSWSAVVEGWNELLEREFPSTKKGGNKQECNDGGA